MVVNFMRVGLDYHALHLNRFGVFNTVRVGSNAVGRHQCEEVLKDSLAADHVDFMSSASRVF